MPPLETAIDLVPMALRAAVSSINESARTVDVTFSTGAPVERLDWASGKRYLEVLSLKPGHVRLERLNAGASLLNSHAAAALKDIVGAVEPGTARVDGTHGLATVRFSRRPDVQPYWQDVIDGIVRFVSVGYRVHKFLEDSRGGGEMPTRTAVDWEPYEISLVAMPADAGATVRGDLATANRCVIVADDRRTEDADRLRRLRLAQARAAVV